MMAVTTILLNAYYEALYERLKEGYGALITAMEKLLRAEIAERKFAGFDENKYDAYRQACVAFLDERIETYNPIGIQYTFGRSRTREAAELEMQLDWSDSRAEFEALVAAAREKSESFMAEVRAGELADELIEERGAFPDNTILAGYEGAPALCKLPDYILARAIEVTIR
jgi:hypothetical protein